MDLAFAASSSLIALAPDSPSGYAETIAMLLGSERVEAAQSVLSVSLQNFPASGDLLYLAGKIAFRERDFVILFFIVPAAFVPGRQATGAKALDALDHCS